MTSLPHDMWRDDSSSYDGEPDRYLATPRNRTTSFFTKHQGSAHMRRTGRRFYCDTCGRTVAAGIANLPCEGRKMAGKATHDYERRSWTEPKLHERAENLACDIDDGLGLARDDGDLGDGDGVCHPVSYEPRLGVMLDGNIWLDSLPRECPPFVSKVSKRRRKTTPDQVMQDWDLVSVATEESFYVV